LGRGLRLALPVAVIGGTLLVAPPYDLFLPSHVAAQLRQLAMPVLTCPKALEEFDGVCQPKTQAQVLALISSYVDQHTQPFDSIVIFPYETLIGVTARRDVAGGVLQSYLVNGDYLSGLELAGLQQKRPPLGLYFPDGTLGDAVDSVPSFTRSPQLWFYLLEHYRGDTSPLPGSASLFTDETRAARLTFSQQKIAQSAGPVRLTKRSTSLPLRAVQWPESGADFIKLRLRVDYPFWWRLRKPSKLALQIAFADGTEKRVEFVTAPNRASDVWFYPWEEVGLMSYFSPNAAYWRPGVRPSITGLTLLVNTFDWSSVVPNSVTIEGVDGIRLESKSAVN
jgi:hypothetical protein